MAVCSVLNSASNSLFSRGGWLAGGDEFFPRPSLACLSKYAPAPNTFLPPVFKTVFDSLGELLSVANPRLGSSFLGVTDVRKAFVDRMPSFDPILVLIERDDGSLSNPPLCPKAVVPKLSPLTSYAMRT